MLSGSGCVCIINVLEVCLVVIGVSMREGLLEVVWISCSWGEGCVLVVWMAVRESAIGAVVVVEVSLCVLS